MLDIDLLTTITTTILCCCLMSYFVIAWLEWKHIVSNKDAKKLMLETLWLAVWLTILDALLISSKL